MQGGVFLKNKVEQLRKERGLNQDDFAKMLRVSRQTISSIETGKYNPSLELAFAISDFFGKRIEEIFIYERGAENEKEQFDNRDTICAFRRGLFDCCAVD